MIERAVQCPTQAPATQPEAGIESRNHPFAAQHGTISQMKEKFKYNTDFPNAHLPPLTGALSSPPFFHL